MKKALLSFVAFGCALVSHAQPQHEVSFDATCVDPVTVSYTIVGTSKMDYPIDVKVYYDANGDATLDGGDVLIVNQTVVDGSGTPLTFVHDSAQTNFLFRVLPSNCDVMVIAFSCEAPITLPVTLQSFSAVRTGNNVSLKWVTATEINNRGFFVQKLQSNRTWTNVTFIPSQSADGNSTSQLTYTFNDKNNSRGVTQYRLVQVDIDGKARYSDIKSVRGDQVSPKTTVFPNPSAGVTNILFDNRNTSRDILISDINGRIVKEFRSVTDDNVQVNDLKPGVYSIKVLDRDGTQSNERLVVGGR